MSNAYMPPIAAEVIEALKAKCEAYELLTTFQQQSIDQLKINCEAYRNAPESELQDKLDEAEARVQELEELMEGKG